MARKSKGVTLGELSKLARAVTPEVLTAIPEIAASHAKLSGMVTEVQDLLAERAVHEARAQEATRRIDEILEAGGKTATFVRTGLRVHFGSDSEELVAFMIKPFRGRKRARKDADPEAPTVSDDSNG